VQAPQMLRDKSAALCAEHRISPFQRTLHDDGFTGMFLLTSCDNFCSR
jgi:hypothetical protein